MQFFVVGAGIWGSVIAERISADLQMPVTIFEKRSHVGGNCHSFLDPDTGIECHSYGSHIFHTSIPEVAKYINRFCSLNSYRHKVFTRHRGKVYPMPINLATINSFYGKDFTPSEAEDFLNKEISTARIGNPANLEEKAISLIGRPLYEAFIKNYTMKQWHRDPRDLPADIITRLPFRTSLNNDYFNDPVQGIPADGYFGLFEKLLANPLITVELNTDFALVKDKLPKDAIILYTGMPDELFESKYGRLDWRSLRFEWENKPEIDYQGTSVMNYADPDMPFTRIHEFKHYHPERKAAFAQVATIICREFPQDYKEGREACYPVNTEANRTLYKRYVGEAEKNPRLILGGRLASYQYWDMDKAIDNALETYEHKIKKFNFN